MELRAVSVSEQLHRKLHGQLDDLHYQAGSLIYERNVVKIANMPLGPYMLTLCIVEELANEGVDGLYNPKVDEIQLSNLLDSNQVLEIILHESLHAIADAYGVKLTEQSVRTLGAALAQILSEVVEVRDVVMKHYSKPLPKELVPQSSSHDVRPLE